MQYWYCQFQTNPYQMQHTYTNVFPLLEAVFLNFVWYALPPVTFSTENRFRGTCISRIVAWSQSWSIRFVVFLFLHSVNVETMRCALSLGIIRFYWPSVFPKQIYYSPKEHPWSINLIFEGFWCNFFGSYISILVIFDLFECHTESHV